jgi:hypothetical protein
MHREDQKRCLDIEASQCQFRLAKQATVRTSDTVRVPYVLKLAQGPFVEWTAGNTSL